MVKFLDCARRHRELASRATPILPELVAEVEELARGVAASPLVHGRIKSLGSTWLKAHHRRSSVDSIHDLVGVRVIVDEVEECYAVLAALGQRWPLVEPPEDYIGRPKQSGYQSLHATFATASALPCEVQIRTRAMHASCERGSLAHWLYKRRQLDEVAAPPSAASLPTWLGAEAGAGDSAPSRSGAAVDVGGGEPPSWHLRAAIMALGVVMVGAVCLLDWLSGDQVGFSVLYLIPVSLVTWRVGGTAGLVTAALSTAAWWLSDRASPVATQPLLQGWDGLMRFATFALLSRTLASLRTALAELKVMATTDHLTGALNSRGFFTAATLEMERAQRHQRPLTAAFIDLDDFKRVNDELGHGAADDLLKQWAQAVRRRLRSTDLLARMGGDEFAVLLPETSMAAADELLARLHRELSEEARRLAMPVTFSMGAVTFTSAPASVESMLHEADVLMYAAKSQGKDGWRHEARGGVLETSTEPHLAQARR